MQRLPRVLSACTFFWLVVGSCTTTPETKPEQDNQDRTDLTARLELAGTVEYVPIGDSPCHGPDHALVTVVEFTDFECSHCAKAQETLQALKDKYGDGLRICYKHRTIPMHFFSRDAAEAAEAAHRQGKFWPMHDLLFANQKALGPDDLLRYASVIRLDLERFNADRINNEEIFKAVDRDEELAAQLKVRSTPTFFINGRRLSGAKPLAEFVELIDQGKGDAQRAIELGVPRSKVYRTIIKTALAPSLPKTSSVHIAADDPCRGPKSAPVTLVEFTDFECPFCSMAKSTVDFVEQEYGDKVRVCVKLYPMDYHPHGRSSSLIALAAGRQGHFFTLYDDLFANQDALDDISVILRARELGLDVERLEQDAASPAVLAQLQRHKAEAQKARVKGTPTFVINGEMIFGAKPYQDFKAVIDKQLQQ